MFATIDFLGWPQRYALLELADAAGSAEFSDFDQDQPDATITSDTGRDSGLRAAPGELWTLRAKSVGEFNAADPKGFIDIWSQCVVAISASTFTPMRFFSDPGGQHPSGDSLRAADLQLKAKIRSRQLTLHRGLVGRLLLRSSDTGHRR